MAPLAMPLVAAIPPLPGTVNELAAPLGVVTVQRSSALTAPPAAVPLPTLGTADGDGAEPRIAAAATAAATDRPPHRALAEVSSGGRGGDDLAPPPGTT